MPNRIILLIVKEYRTILMGLFIGFALFCLYMACLYKPVYTASTKMYIRNLPKTNIITDYGNNEDVKSQSGYSNPLFNINQIIESHQVADKVYSKIKVKYSSELKRIGVSNKNSWYGVFSSMLTLKIEPSTDVIKVTLNWNNKEQTADLLDIVVDEFKTENLKISKDTEIKQRQFLDKQLIKVAKELRNVRLAIRDYREKSHSINNLSESQELTKARVGLEQQREFILSKISYESRKLNNLEDQIGLPNVKAALKAGEIGTDPYLVQLNQSLASMHQQYAKLSSIYTDNYPEVISAKNQIRSLTNSIKTRQKEVLQKIAVSRGVYNESSSKVIDGISSSDAERTALSAQLGTIKEGINQLKSEESKLAGKDFGLDELRKEEEALLTAYTSVKEKQLEATILENQIIDNIVVLGGSAVQSNALSSIIGKLIGFLALGFLGSLAFAWIKEEIEDKWVDSKEIEIITEKKVLGVIPWVKCQQDLPKDFIMENDSIMGVSYGNIVSSIISESYLKEVQAISFLSTIQSRGKSLMLPNIALTLARMNRSVIIVDIDFIRPNKFFTDFNIVSPQNKPDIINVIDEINRELRMHKEINNDYLQHIVSGSKSSIDVTVQNGAELSFSYLCAQKEVHNISDYVATRGFKTLIDFLKEQYEFILIDTPSRPHLYPEFSYITEFSDGIVIISAMETNREKLISLIDKVEKTNTCVLGIIAREEDSALEMYFSAKNGEGSLCTPICNSTGCNEKNI
jgi:uncharacterized protein involved in exopolysaccharide biosynthesis/Mrp family chromosome partitioning ATPase